METLQEVRFTATRPATIDLAHVALSPELGPEICIEISGDSLPRHIVEIGRAPSEPEAGVLIAHWNTNQGVERGVAEVRPNGRLQIRRAPRGEPLGLVPYLAAGNPPTVLQIRNKAGHIELQSTNGYSGDYQGVARFYPA
jgi:hypothetical protein